MMPVQKRTMTMSALRNTRLFATLGAAADVFGSAVAVAAAVEANRLPRARDLKALGIAPDAFRSIGRD